MIHCSLWHEQSKLMLIPANNNLNQIITPNNPFLFSYLSSSNMNPKHLQQKSGSFSMQ